MNTSYKITKDEYFQGLMLGSKSPLLFRTPLYLFLTIYIVLGLFSLYQTLFVSSKYLELLLLSGLILTFAALYRPVIQKRQFNKYYRTSIDVGLDTKITITENGFDLDSGSSSTKRSWSKLTGWKEDQDLFLFYVSDRTFHILPKRVFSDSSQAEELIRNKLNEFTIPYKKIPPGAVFSSVFYLLFSIWMIYIFLR